MSLGEHSFSQMSGTLQAQLKPRRLASKRLAPPAAHCPECSDSPMPSRLESRMYAGVLRRFAGCDSCRSASMSVPATGFAMRTCRGGSQDWLIWASAASTSRTAVRARVGRWSRRGRLKDGGQRWGVRSQYCQFRHKNVHQVDPPSTGGLEPFCCVSFWLRCSGCASCSPQPLPVPARNPPARAASLSCHAARTASFCV